MSALPLMLRIAGRRCVIVGGGEVALRRAEALVEAGGQVTVIAPALDERLGGLDVHLVRRGYEAGDLAGAWLAVIATDDASVNEAAAAEARQAGALVNRADDPEAGDVTVPAHARHGPITLAVDTGGVSASASAAIRRELEAALDPAWAALLEEASAYRGRIQAAFADPAARRDRLRRLTDRHAVDILKSQGRQALRTHYQRIVEEASSE